MGWDFSLIENEIGEKKGIHNKEVLDFLYRLFSGGQLEDIQLIKNDMVDMIAKIKNYVNGKPFLANPFIQDNTHNIFAYIPPTDNFSMVILNHKLNQIDYDGIDIRLKARNSADLDNVKTIEGVLQSIWNRSNVSKPIMKTAKDAFSLPMGITKIIHKSNDPFNFTPNNFKFKSIDIDNFFWDPRAYDIEDATWVFELKLVPFEFLRGIKQFDQELVDKILMTNWMSIDYLVQKKDYNNDINNFAKKFNVYIRELYYIYNYKNNTPKVCQIFLVDGISQEQGGAVLYYVDDIKTGMLPYSIFREKNVSNHFCGMSSMEQSFPKQEMLCKYEIIKMNSIGNAIFPTRIVNSQSGLSTEQVSDAATNAGMTLGVNGPANEAVFTLENTNSNSEVLQQIPEMKNNMLSVAGLSNFDLGQTGSTGSISTTGGMNVLQSQSAARDTENKVNFKNYIKRIIRILYSTLKNSQYENVLPVESKDPSEQVRFVKFKDLNISRIDVDFDVNAITSKAQKDLNKQTIQFLLQLETQNPDLKILSKEYVIKELDLPNKDILIKNVKDNDAQVQAAKQQQEDQAIQQASMIGIRAAVSHAVQLIIQDEQNGGALNNQTIESVEKECVTVGMQASSQLMEQMNQQQEQQNGGTGGGLGGTQNGIIDGK